MELPGDMFNDPDHRKAEELMFEAERSSGCSSKLKFIEAGKLELNVARKIQEHHKLRSIFAISSISCFLCGKDKTAAIQVAQEFLKEPDKLTPGGKIEIENLIRNV